MWTNVQNPSTNDCVHPYICVNHPSGYGCDPPEKGSNKARMAIIGTTSGLGGLLLITALWWLHKIIRSIKKRKLREKFFKRNGGLLLRQQLSSGEEGTVEKTKVFTSKELEKATDRYNESRILDQGGQGTVYKGMLRDGRIVAVKKSKISTAEDEGKLQQFINEFPLSWDMRLGIATEIAGALQYLHSAASLPKYHRDIKSTNILLDDKYRSKVADFGTSRSVGVDQTHLTTRVSGTFGYLDPEYFQSSQFTDKSDVYSFRVVLIELLTGQKPVLEARSDDGRSLATHFKLAMEECNCFDILDARVVKEGGKDEIMRVANLAKRCLNLNGRKRPTMKQVAMELEGIRMSNGGPAVQQQYEELEYNEAELVATWDTASTSSSSYVINTAVSPLHVQPLLSSVGR
ncbi:hypothetical protein RJ639_010579 [Escallonia herrerae]|uniref:Protein kinase domain-containing protein n=1 Tax=Escallonia herrerae TaxID=1293975 RepID=A0AA89AUA6_9ASTE|nr:hypothetical protein RJ639_010579 [Escallonia herrerae]